MTEQNERLGMLAERDELKRKIEEAIRGGETKQLKKIMLELIGKIYARLELKTGRDFSRRNKGELQLDIEGKVKFTPRDLIHTMCSFYTGTAGERLFFVRDDEDRGIQLFYPRPDEDSYRFGGKFWEEFNEIFGSDRVALDI